MAKYDSGDYNAEELSEEGMDKHDEYIENVELDDDGEPTETMEEYYEREEEEKHDE